MLRITQGRVRPKLTGLWQVSNSKRMGLAFGTPRGAGRPGPGDVPPTSGISTAHLGLWPLPQASAVCAQNKGSLPGRSGQGPSC